MIRVTYVSREAPGLTSDKLLALVSQCHRNNPDKGLTGMLLHGNGTFLQVLEGDDHVVDTLIGAIAADPRHIDMKIVRREPVTRRQFADWSMGFERVTDESLKGFRDYTTLACLTLRRSSSAAMTMSSKRCWSDIAPPTGIHSFASSMRATS